MKSSIASRVDVYTRVTNKLIVDLDRGVRPWMKPWSGDSNRGIALPLRHCGTPYRGINIVLLLSEAMDKGYAAGRWMTFQQASKLGGYVRKGEHGTLVVYADTFTKTEQDANGSDVEREIPFMKGYTVFNVEQIEGLPAHYYDRPVRPEPHMPLVESSEKFFAAMGAVVRHGGDSAFYAPGPDIIQLPFPESFRDAESYAAVKAHEFVHWTRHKPRLDRNFGIERFGDDAYAREELVAEMGAAFLCALLGITAEVREDHAAYLAIWLSVLAADRRAIFQAAAHAQRAVDYLQRLQVPLTALT